MMFVNIAARAGVVKMEKITHQFGNVAARAGVVEMERIHHQNHQ
jgi:hypothetical protein